MLDYSDTLKRVGTIGLSRKELKKHRDHPNRELLFKDVSDMCGGSVVYLEFGVFEGASIKIAVDAFGEKLKNAYGFDSFEGLPDDWKHSFGKISEKGSFNVDGKMPDIELENVSFVKGWFENTLPSF